MTYFRPGFWEFRSIPHQKVTMLRAPRAAKNTHWSFPMNRSRWNIRHIQNTPTSNSMLTQHFEMYHIYPKCALLTIETYWYTNLLLVLQLHHSQRVLCKTETYLYSAIFRKCRYCLVLSSACLPFPQLLPVQLVIAINLRTDWMKQKRTKNWLNSCRLKTYRLFHK